MVTVTQINPVFKWQFNLGMLVFAGVFLPLTIALGLWQLQRAEEKQAMLEEYRARDSAAPMAFASLSREGDHQYRRVELVGRLAHQHSVLLENRVQEGKPGYEVLTPVELGGEQPWVWVNRGWIAAGSYDRSTLPEIPVEAGEVQLRGHLYQAVKKPFSLGEEIWRSEGPQVFQNLDLVLLSAQLGREFFPYILRLDQDSPAALQTGWDVVTVMPEKHTGYAVQWFALAAALLILSLFANSNLGAVIKRQGVHDNHRS